MATDFISLHREIQELKDMIQKVADMQQADHAMTVEHDKILIRGNGVPSLQETVRVMGKAVHEFVDEVRVERKRRNEEEAVEAVRQRDERTRWKWTFIGLALTIVPAFLWQIIVFWVQIAPTLP